MAALTKAQHFHEKGPQAPFFRSRRAFLPSREAIFRTSCCRSHAPRRPGPPFCETRRCDGPGRRSWSGADGSFHAPKWPTGWRHGRCAPADPDQGHTILNREISIDFGIGHHMKAHLVGMGQLSARERLAGAQEIIAGGQHVRRQAQTHRCLIGGRGLPAR
jgi:hypothetical protein